MTPALLLVASFTINSQGAKTDVDALKGTWTCVSGVIDGKPLPDETARQLRLVLTDDLYTTTRGDQTLFEGKYTLEPNTSPKRIDIRSEEGENAGKSAQGIYKIEGDTHTICYTMPGHERPKDFASAVGSGAFLIVWKKAKP